MLPGQRGDNLPAKLTPPGHTGDLRNASVRARINVIRNKDRLTIDDSPCHAGISKLAFFKRETCRADAFFLSGQRQLLCGADPPASFRFVLLLFRLRLLKTVFSTLFLSLHRVRIIQPWSGILLSKLFHLRFKLLNPLSLPRNQLHVLCKLLLQLQHQLQQIVVLHIV